MMVYLKSNSQQGILIWGGSDFDNILVNISVMNSNENINQICRGSKRAMRRLKTACERAKKVLSTSNTASVELESLYEGIDFFFTNYESQI